MCLKTVPSCISKNMGADAAGWRAFAACPELGQDCPGPYFMEGIDSSSLILEAIDKQLFGKQPASGADPAAATPASPWWQGITTNLKKVCCLLSPHGADTDMLPPLSCHVFSFVCTASFVIAIRAASTDAPMKYAACKHH